MNLSELYRRDFSGLDVNLDISLGEYGLAWKEYKRNYKDKKKGDCLFVYGIGGDEFPGLGFVYTSFDHCHLSPSDFISDYDWADFSAVASMCGMDKEDWLELSFPSRIADMVSYYGTENIFGSSYYGGFSIGGITKE
jgi:hypothetical protein